MTIWQKSVTADMDCRDFAAKMDEWAAAEGEFTWGKIDAVIFDMDGTLVDSMYYWLHLSDDWFLRQGLDIPEMLPEEFATADLWEASELLARDWAAKPTTAQAVFDELAADIDRHYAEDIELMPHRRELLAALLAKNIPACIATMTDRPQVETVLKTHGIGSFFRFVLTTPEVGSGKDKPDIFLRAAERLGTKIERTLVVEDSRTAIKTALFAGFPVVVVKTDGYDYGEIEELAARLSRKIWFVDDFSALLPIDK